MKILIIGGSVLDRIVNENKVKESAGGIYHSALKFLEIKNNNDSLSLCTQISQDTYRYFRDLYDKCDEKYFEEVSQIPIVTLEESSSGYRKESYANIATSLKIDNIDFHKFDGILINMITGKELDCEKLKEIRKKTNALIYFDVHTLSRLSSSICKREFNLIPDFQKWAENLDIIQVNEFELLSLFNISDEAIVAQRLFSVGVKIFIVTKAEKGAKIYFNESNELNFYFKSAKSIQGVSTIGCGDYFGASFFYNYLITKSQFSSLNYAIDEVEKSLEKRLECN